jgi:hypothetical protein
MSLNYIKTLRPVALLDERINFETGETDDLDADQGHGESYGVIRGPKNLEYFPLQPTTGTSSGNAGGPSSTDFTYFMPSRETVLDKCIYLRASAMVAMTNGANGVATLLETNTFAPGSWPLHSSIRVLQIQLDGNVYDVDLTGWHFLKYYYFTADELQTYASMSPTMPDNRCVFNAADDGDPLNNVGGTAANPVPPRGAFGINSFNNTAGTGASIATAYVSYTFTEPLQLPPLLLNCVLAKSSTGLTGFAILKIKIVWKSPSEAFYDGYKMNIFNPEHIYGTLTSTITGDNPPVAAVTYTKPTFQFRTGILPSITGQMFISNPVLLIGNLTVPDIYIAPATNVYDFLRFETHTQTKTFDTSIDQEIIINNYNLSQIPHRVLFAITPSKNSKTFTSYNGSSTIPVFALPEVFYPITNVNIKLGNKSGLMAQMTQEQLFEVNRTNGLVFMNYSNSGVCSNPTYQPRPITAPNLINVQIPQGNPLCLSFGYDIALDDASLAPSVAGNTNFSATLKVKNYYGTPDQVTVSIIYVYEGCYSISASGSSFTIALLSRDDVIRSDENVIDVNELQTPTAIGGTMIGGSFFGKLKKFGRKTKKFFQNKQVQHFLKTGLDTAALLGVPGAEQIQYGVERVGDIQRALHDKGSAFIGGNYMNGAGGNYANGAGGKILGGRILTPEMMRARLAR